jgi:hypothetical protein
LAPLTVEIFTARAPFLETASSFFYNPTERQNKLPVLWAVLS